MSNESRVVLEKFNFELKNFYKLPKKTNLVSKNFKLLPKKST